MKRKITIDTLLNQTLGFNTKSFSESKPIMKPTKRFNYGEVGNAMLVFEIDRYMMKAEAANSRTRLATQFATGEASIVDKAKSVGKAIWDAIIKLFKSLQDMIKNFLSRNKDVEKKLINAAIDKSIKELQSFKAVPDEKGNVTAVSDNNLTKARLSLHKVSTSVNAYIDSAYVTYTNITKSILLTIKNIDSLS